MVDKINPTNQFHPYQPTDVTPVSEMERGGLAGMLSKFGLNTGSLGSIGDRMKNVDMKSQVSKAREVANKNPGLVLGGLAAAAIALGMMRKRSTV